MKKVLIINGPNINLLHKRDRKIYGDQSLDKIIETCNLLADKIGLELVFRQSNHEGEIVDFIQDAIDRFDGIIINAAAYTHTSIAIRDALEIFPAYKIELHISNVFKRDEFRHHSFISEVVDGVICGFGVNGYRLALIAIDDALKNNIGL